MNHDSPPGTSHPSQVLGYGRFTLRNGDLHDRWLILRDTQQNLQLEGALQRFGTHGDPWLRSKELHELRVAKPNHGIGHDNIGQKNSIN